MLSLKKIAQIKELSLIYHTRMVVILSMMHKDSYLGFVCDLHYPNVDDFAEIILEKGTGCALFKTDLRKYYRQIFYDPGSIHLVGFMLEGNFYFDVALSMGLRIACFIAQRISSALLYIYRCRGFLRPKLLR